MKLLTQTEYAAHCGVNKSTVSRWISAGRITPEPNGLINPEKADQERIATESPMPHHQARVAQIAEQKASSNRAEPQPAPSAGESSENAAESLSGRAIADQLRYETMLLQRAKRESAQMEVDIKSRRLIDYNEVEAAIVEIGVTFRKMAENIPDRATPELVAAGGKAETIRQVLVDLMQELLLMVGDEMTRQRSKVTA